MKQTLRHCVFPVLTALAGLVLAALCMAPARAAEVREQGLFYGRTPERSVEGAGLLELGVLFEVRRPGALTGARFYACEDEAGPHRVTVWDYETGTALSDFPEWDVEDAGGGWQTYRFPAAVRLETGKKYVLSVSNNEFYAGYACSEQTGTLSEPVRFCDLETCANGGVFAGGIGRMPDERTHVNFFRDVIFVPDTPYEPAAEGIAVTRPPAKTDYLAGEVFDPAGMEVTAYFDDGTAAAVTDYTWSPDGPLSPEDGQVVITYQPHPWCHC